MRILLVSLLSICLVMVLIAVQAVEVDSLNSGRVQVLNRSTAQVKQALPRAFAQVMVKMSGNTGVMTLPQVQNMLPDIKNYLTRYRYEVATGLLGQRQLWLQVYFDQKAVKQLLRSAGQAIWPRHRPLTLVWLYQRLSGALVLLPTENKLYHALTRGAAARGIAVLFPTMDLQDERDLSAASPSAVPDSLLASEGKRYAVTNVLVGVVKASAPVVEVQWYFLLNGINSQWLTRNAVASSAVVAGVNHLADMMSNQFAAMGSSKLQTRITLEVLNIHTIGVYRRIVSKLRRLPVVSVVSLLSVSPGALVLSVKVAGGEDELVSGLKRDKFLKQVAERGDSKVDLYYRWV